MTHPHAPQGLGLGQGNRPVGLGGGLSGLVGPGSNLSATPALPAQAPGVSVLGGAVPGPGPVALAPAVNSPATAIAALQPPPQTLSAPALDPITSARSRQFTDGFNPRSLF